MKKYSKILKFLFVATALVVTTAPVVTPDYLLIGF